MRNLLMYGGCVARDTYEVLGRAEYKLLDYVSRQSVISAYHRVDGSVLDGLEMSPFQRRNSEGDFRGDLWDRLEQHAARTDALIWDILIDRNGVVRTTDGAYVTFSYDLYRAGVFDRMKEQSLFAERIHFGTDQHFDLWTESVDRYLADLRHAGMLDKLLLVIAPWATETQMGKAPTHWHLGPSPVEANSLYQRYYDFLTNSRSVASVEVPAEATVTRDDHKWGPAPYHYVDSAYEHIRDGISSFLDRRSQAIIA